MVAAMKVTAAALMVVLTVGSGSDVSGAVLSSSAMSPFAGRLSAYISSRLGRATAAVFDIRSGRTWLFRSGDLQATASIVKVDILATLLAREKSSGALPPPDVRTTAAEMIEESDNEAATDLWESVGGHSVIEAFDRKLGMDHTFPSTCLDCPGFAWPGWGLTTTSAADQVTLLRDLVFPDRWLSVAQQQWALGLMAHVVPAERWGISNVVPAGVPVALKNGWVPLPSGLWQIDSIGWVDGGGRDYIAAVLSTGNPSEGYGIATVDTIGAGLYADLGPS
jgi:hypothetical protein